MPEFYNLNTLKIDSQRFLIEDLNTVHIKEPYILKVAENETYVFLGLSQAAYFFSKNNNERH